MQLSGTPARHRQNGMTLVEVMVSLTILIMIMSGLIATMIQSRRMTEGSIRRNMTVNIVNGFLEQMKGMTNGNAITGATNPDAFLLANPILTQDNDTTSDPIYPSSGTPPKINTLTPGVTPANTAGTVYVDNLKDFPMYGANSSGSNLNTGAATTWNAVWPGATTFPTASASIPSSNAYVNDLHLNIWFWVSDMSANSNGAVAPTGAYAVTVIYTWQVNDGGRVRYFDDEVHMIISSVGTYNSVL